MLDKNEIIGTMELSDTDFKIRDVYRKAVERGTANIRTQVVIAYYDLIRILNFLQTKNYTHVTRVKKRMLECYKERGYYNFDLDNLVELAESQGYKLHPTIIKAAVANNGKGTNFRDRRGNMAALLKNLPSVTKEFYEEIALCAIIARTSCSGSKSYARSSMQYAGIKSVTLGTIDCIEEPYNPMFHEYKPTSSQYVSYISTAGYQTRFFLSRDGIPIPYEEESDTNWMEVALTNLDIFRKDPWAFMNDYYDYSRPYSNALLENNKDDHPVNSDPVVPQLTSDMEAAAVSVSVKAETPVKKKEEDKKAASKPVSAANKGAASFCAINTEFLPNAIEFFKKEYGNIKGNDFYDIYKRNCCKLMDCMYRFYQMKGSSNISDRIISNYDYYARTKCFSYSKNSSILFEPTIDDDKSYGVLIKVKRVRDKDELIKDIRKITPAHVSNRASFLNFLEDRGKLINKLKEMNKDPKQNPFVLYWFCVANTLQAECGCQDATVYNYIQKKKPENSYIPSATATINYAKGASYVDRTCHFPAISTVIGFASVFGMEIDFEIVTEEEARKAVENFPIPKIDEKDIENMVETIRPAASKPNEKKLIFDVKLNNDPVVPVVKEEPSVSTAPVVEAEEDDEEGLTEEDKEAIMWDVICSDLIKIVNKTVPEEEPKYIKNMRNSLLHQFIFDLAERMTLKEEYRKR